MYKFYKSIKIKDLERLKIKRLRLILKKLEYIDGIGIYSVMSHNKLEQCA